MCRLLLQTGRQGGRFRSCACSAASNVAGGWWRDVIHICLDPNLPKTRGGVCDRAVQEVLGVRWQADRRHVCDVCAVPVHLCTCACHVPGPLHAAVGACMWLRMHMHRPACSGSQTIRTAGPIAEQGLTCAQVLLATGNRANKRTRRSKATSRENRVAPQSRLRRLLHLCGKLALYMHICVCMCCACSTGIVYLLRQLLPELRKHPGNVGVGPGQGDEIVPLKDKQGLLESAEHVSRPVVHLLCNGGIEAGCELLCASVSKRTAG